MTYQNYLVVSVDPVLVESFLNKLSDLFRRNRQDHWSASDSYSVIAIWPDPVIDCDMPVPYLKVNVAISCNLDYLSEEQIRGVNGVEK